MSRRIACLLGTFLFANALNLFAAEQQIARLAPSEAETTPLADAIARAAVNTEPPVTLWSLSQQPKRPGLLPVLYGTYAGMQVMDVVSTQRALRAGAIEANPLMKRGGMATTLAIKAVSTVGMVYVTEKMWKKHRVGAIALMAVVNGVSAAVVVHNNRNASRR